MSITKSSIATELKYVERKESGGAEGLRSS